MRLLTLVEISERVRLTERKKAKVSLMAGLLGQARGREIALAASYLSGRLPQGRLGLGCKMLREAAEGLSPSPRPVTLVEVDAFFEAVAGERGAGSAQRRLRIIRELFSRCEEGERAFLTGLIMGEIRHGALEGLVLEAAARASALPLGRLRQALMFSGEIGEVARAALEEGGAGLSRFRPRLFQPISPMLASPAEDEREAAARLGEAAWEYKIDGARVQIHKGGDEVRIFTRHLKEVTGSVPEIVALARNFAPTEAIVEGEVVALGRDGKPLSFQATMRRFGRKKEVAEVRKTIPLNPYFFDLLYLDGEALFEVPYRERIRQLASVVSAGHLIPRIITADEKKAREFLLRSLEAGHEGLMAKALESRYTAGQRGYNWLKIKPFHTLDLVVLAAEWGHGRRRGWLSNLHLGARDPGAEGFVMLGKTFKGLTDEMLRWQTRRLLDLELGRDGGTVYVRPEIVVEVAFHDVQESPRYPGGLALRFARVKRFRQDKTAREADTFQKVEEIFQEGTKKEPGTSGAEKNTSSQ
ncbi:MAG: ATP-dependent DNA ligase [Deltaproteobacteria bacterium]|nr:ATP-dependent DNA ligase [Deltaproteobacteria bacterium]MBW2120429.1 ATP-dependent DNA ligase [Deltaproteobacteria bacterium]